MDFRDKGVQTQLSNGWSVLDMVTNTMFGKFLFESADIAAVLSANARHCVRHVTSLVLETMPLI